MDRSDTAEEFIRSLQAHRAVGKVAVGIVTRWFEQKSGLIGSGTASVAEIAELARCCVRDGLPKEAVSVFASLGCDGKYPANQERDLHRWLRQLYSLDLEPYNVPF